MRTRFRQLLAAVGLPTKTQGQERPLDLGSLRAGGATHLLMITEDSELVRKTWQVAGPSHYGNIFARDWCYCHVSKLTSWCEDKGHAVGLCLSWSLRKDDGDLLPLEFQKQPGTIYYGVNRWERWVQCLGLHQLNMLMPEKTTHRRLSERDAEQLALVVRLCLNVPVLKLPFPASHPHPGLQCLGLHQLNMLMPEKNDAQKAE